MAVTIAALHLCSPETFSYITAVKLLLATILLQSSSNLINSYFDFKSGVDHPQKKGGDRGILDGYVTPKEAFKLGFVYMGASIAMVATLPRGKSIETGTEWGGAVLSPYTCFLIGCVLAIVYTAPPFALKSRGLGDFCIFFAFGPLLMTFASLYLAPSLETLKSSLWPLSVPMGMVTVAILHANNTRDIQNDLKVGSYTMANIMGFDLSRKYYIFLLFGSYAACAFLAMSHTFKGAMPGCLGSLLSVPAAVTCVKEFTEDNLQDADERTAGFHMAFGMTLTLGLFVASWF